MTQSLAYFSQKWHLVCLICPAPWNRGPDYLCWGSSPVAWASLYSLCCLGPSW